MSTLPRTQALDPIVTVADLPEQPPRISTTPYAAGLCGFVGVIAALIQFISLQNPEPSGIYTTIWTLLLWPFGFGAAGLIFDYIRSQRETAKLQEWTAKMLAYALTVQSRHAVTDHTKAAVDPANLRAMVEQVIEPRLEQLRADLPASPETLSASIAGTLGRYKLDVLTTVLSWIMDSDHIWTTDQWAIIAGFIAAMESGFSPKVKHSRTLSVEIPPTDFASLLTSHPADVVRAISEWIADPNTEWTPAQLTVVEQIADAAFREDYEPKIEVRSRRSRPS